MIEITSINQNEGPEPKRRTNPVQKLGSPDDFLKALNKELDLIFKGQEPQNLSALSLTDFTSTLEKFRAQTLKINKQNASETPQTRKPSDIS